MAGLFRILSIDGGGIRGIIPGQILVALERELQRRDGAEARLADYFDLVAGTSTGGILACILLCPDAAGRPRFTAREAVDLYLEHGDEIFDVPFFHRLRTVGGTADEKYPAAALEQTLESYFGDLQLKQLLKPCLIPAYDIRKRRAVFFTQHDAGRASRNYLVRNVARATSAAPTYFEVACIESMARVPRPLIDGGVFANNPALCAYAEARKRFKKTASRMAILSLGTGDVRKPYEYEEAKDWGPIGWAKPLIDIMMSAVSETVHYQLRQIYETVERPEQYLRIDVDLSRLPDGVSPEMDDASAQNTRVLEGLGIEAADEHRSALRRFADFLVEEKAPDVTPDATREPARTRRAGRRRSR